MRKTKDQKGITLVALIITIVVLLILAIVAIGQAQESNIVGYAQNAAGKFEEAKGNEITELSNSEKLLEKYSSTSNVSYLEFCKAAYKKIGTNAIEISEHVLIYCENDSDLGIYYSICYGDYNGLVEDEYDDIPWLAENVIYHCRCCSFAVHTRYRNDIVIPS